MKDYSQLSRAELDKLHHSNLGKEVPVAEINGELVKLWEEEEALTRASLTNFAVYSEENGALLSNTELLPKITKEHASRSILISCPHSAESKTDQAQTVQAWINAHCQIRKGNKTVCSEQISFLLENAAADRVRNIVFSHLDSDLPLVFWWQGKLSDNFEDRLYSVIDRLIIDSADWNNPQAQFETLLDAAAEKGTRFAINDLNWARSYYLRSSLAGSLQDPAAAAILPALTKIRLEHNADSPLAAQMLVAWIATRLECQIQQQGQEITLQRANASDIKIEFADNAKEVNHNVNLIRLESSLGSIEVRPSSKGIYWRSDCQLSGIEDCKNHQALSPSAPADPAALVSQILERSGSNRLYKAMLPKLMEILKIT